MAVTSISVNAVGITAYAETIKEDAGNNMAAEECKGDPGFGICHISYEEQLQNILDNPDLDNDQKEAAVIAINEAIMLRDSFPEISLYAAASYSTITIPVTAYTQEEEFYCGPATARQTLEFLGSIVPGGYTPPPQSKIAEDIKTSKKDGTEWYNLIEYINYYKFMSTPHTYIEHNLNGLSNMETIIYNSLTQTRPEPPILQIDTGNDSSVLGYSTDGHYLNVSGIRTVNGNNEFQLTDPYRQRKSLSAKYYVKTYNIYNFTDNHWAKHFMC